MPRGKRNRAPTPKAASSAPCLVDGGRFNASNPSRVSLTEYEKERDLGDLSSDDEEAKNTVGNVPRVWYEEESHIGYDVSGQRIGKKGGKDGIDRFLSSQDDPNHKWTIYDEENDEEIVLSARDVLLLKRIRDGGYAHPEFEAYPDFYDSWSKVEVHPLHNAPEPKRRFLPSKWEGARVAAIAKAIRAGTYKVKENTTTGRLTAGMVPPAYLLWGEDGYAIGGEGNKGFGLPPLPAPRPPLPGHAASYNPPPEYLPTPEEAAAWHALPPSQRPTPFLPSRASSLRSVPLYAPGVREAFERCLDLYLCPRAAGRRLQVEDPDSLLPSLPDPSQLKPFPVAISQAFSLQGAGLGRARSVSFDPTGAWAASGGEDGWVGLWDTAMGRCVRKWKMAAPVACLEWNPVLHVIAVACGVEVVFIYPGTAVHQSTAASTFAALAATAAATAATAAAKDVTTRKGDKKEEEEEEEEEEKGDAEDVSGDVNLYSSRWGALDERLKRAEDLLPPKLPPAPLTTLSPPTTGFPPGILFSISHTAPVKSLAWHRRGDYIAASTPNAPTGQVMVHQLSRRASVCPFAKNLGLVQSLKWHPVRPLLFVANQRSVRAYDLQAGSLTTKYQSTVQWISSLDVHPTGEHILAGSYDHKTVWWDTELGTTPYKTLHFHTAAVRRAVFHPGGFPLLATCSDDGSIHVLHAKVTAGDWSSNPVIVPLKILRGHTPTAEGGLGVLDCAWHPTLPWLLSTGADGKLLLWRD